MFEGVGWFDVGLAVFLRRYDFLIGRLVRVGGRLERMSRGELKGMLKERLRPISAHDSRASLLKKM